MGRKKHSAFKNIAAVLCCTVFAGAYGFGGYYLVNAVVNNGGADAVPAWLNKVEIRVNEQAALAQNAAKGEQIASDQAGQEQNSSSQNNGDDSFSDNMLPEPRFKEEEAETETITEEQTQEPETEASETDRNEEKTSAEEKESGKKNNGKKGSGTEASNTEETEAGETETEEAGSEETEESETETQNEKKSREPQVTVRRVEALEQEEVPAAAAAGVTAVVKAAMPCVVSITNEYTAYDYWYDEEVDEEANGSGIIVAQSEEELLIVTNYHVIEDNNSLYVQFIDDEETAAYVKGVSPENDLAIVSVFLEDMQEETLESIAIAALGDSDSLQVGEPAIAIGNSLGYGQSVTTGVISALNRDIFGEDADTSQGYLIQTDAAINPGNSGGALLNVRGEVIGINSSKIADYVIEGMGYAIPISTAKPIIEDLMQKETRKKVAAQDRAFLGISGTDVTEDIAGRFEMPEGVYVSKVLEGTAAEEAGILKGDIITYIDGEKTRQMAGLQNLLEYYAAGAKVEVVLMRQSDGEYRELTIEVTLGQKENE